MQVANLKIKEKIKRGNLLKLSVTILTVILPILVLYFLLIVNGKGLNPQIFIPTFNDEVSWFSQVESMIKYGRTLGYEGYNLTHATVGTYGAWGVASLIPYALIGLVIGWDLHSMVIANVILLSFAIAVFIWLTKPNMQQLLWLGAGYLCMNITIGYSMLAMAESLRYALAIILAGMLIKLYNGEQSKIFKYAVLPIVLFYAIQVYLIFALLVPIYIFGILKEKKLYVRLIVSVVTTGIVACLSNYLCGLVTAPYVVSTREGLLQGILSNPYQGMVEVLRTFFFNAKTLNPVTLINLVSYDETGTYMWFFFIYWIMIGWIGKQVLAKKSFYYNVSFYLLIGFLGGYCALYTGECSTLCRGLNTGIVFIVFFLVHESDKRGMKLFILLSFLGCISSWWYYTNRVEKKDTAYAHSAHILEEREKINKIVDISKENGTWGNTIAHYGTVSNVYLELPIGIGTNYMIDESLNTKARWAAVSKCDEEIYFKARLEKLMENHHKIVYENEDLVILEYMDF